VIGTHSSSTVLVRSLFISSLAESLLPALLAQLVVVPVGIQLVPFFIRLAVTHVGIRILIALVVAAIAIVSAVCIHASWHDNNIVGTFGVRGAFELDLAQGGLRIELEGCRLAKKLAALAHFGENGCEEVTVFAVSGDVIACKMRALRLPGCRLRLRLPGGRGVETVVFGFGVSIGDSEEALSG
jgi:hypothetical protein